MRARRRRTCARSAALGERGRGEAGSRAGRPPSRTWRCSSRRRATARRSTKASHQLARVRYFSRFLEEVERHRGGGALVSEERIPPDSRSPCSRSGTAVGIDLGHHQLAGGGGGRTASPRACPSRRGRRAAPPSVVHYAADGGVVVGDARPGAGGRVPHRHHRVGEALHGQEPRRRRDPASWARYQFVDGRPMVALRGGGRPRR